MSPSQSALLDDDQLRWTELSAVPAESPCGCASPAQSLADFKSCHHPLFTIRAQWGPRFQSHSIRVDPLFRSAWFAALGQRRLYYPFVLLVIALSVVWLFQPWISGWTGACIQLALVLCVWLPLVLVECTRLDRYLLGFLLRSWDFWFLFTNWCMGQVFFFMRRSESFPAYAVLNGVTLNLGFWCVSALTFAMDALPQVCPQYKAVWMATYMACVLTTFIQVRGDDDLEVRVCFIFCTTARSFINSTQLTQLAFAAKYLFYLVREPGRLMIVRPHANLSLHPADEVGVVHGVNAGAVDAKV